MKSPLIKILIGLTITLIILGFCDYLIPDTSWMTDYIRGLFTNTLAIIITLIFVERILANQRKKDERGEEIKKIKRLDKILRSELQKCVSYASFLTQKPGEGNYTVSKNFDFNRLEHFHIPSLNIFDGSEKAHKYFAKTVERILTIIREALINYDFRYFKDIENLFMEYTEFMSIGTPFGALETLGYNQSIELSMSNMIKEIPAGTVPKYEEYPSNLMLAFIRLYHVINFHLDFNERYNSAVSGIEDQ